MSQIDGLASLPGFRWCNRGSGSGLDTHAGLTLNEPPRASQVPGALALQNGELDSRGELQPIEQRDEPQAPAIPPEPKPLVPAIAPTPQPPKTVEQMIAEMNTVRDKGNKNKEAASCSSESCSSACEEASFSREREAAQRSCAA